VYYSFFIYRVANRKVCPNEIEEIEECTPPMRAVRGSLKAVRGSLKAVRGSFDSSLPLDKIVTLYYIITMWFSKGGRL